MSGIVKTEIQVRAAGGQGSSRLYNHDKIKQLYESGVKKTHICKMLGCHYQTVLYVIDRDSILFKKRMTKIRKKKDSQEKIQDLRRDIRFLTEEKKELQDRVDRLEAIVEEYKKRESLLSVEKFQTEKEKIDFFKEEAAKMFGIKVSLLKVKSRKREIVQSRQLYFYLMCNYTKLTYREMTEKLELIMDHSTVIHARQAIEDLKETDKLFRLRMSNLEEVIKLKNG